jgi:O-methyltransferase
LSETNALFGEAMTKLDRHRQCRGAGQLLAPFKHAVDIGGGHGSFLCAILDHHPDAKATLFDLPSVGADALYRKYQCCLELWSSPRLCLVTVEASDPIGSPEKPLSDTQFEAKFRDCARNAVRPLSDASVDAVLAAIGRLEKLADARELLTPFAQ